MTHLDRWDALHDSSTEAVGARMLLATRDGDFRITASREDGRVRLLVEKRRCETNDDETRVR